MGVLYITVEGCIDCHKAAERLYRIRNQTRPTAESQINLPTGDPSLCPSFSPIPRSVASQQAASIHDRTYFQARQERHAIRDRQDQGMATRLRARAAARGRTVDGLDQLRRHEAAADHPLRY